MPPDGTGKRRRVKVSGQTKTAVKVKLADLRRQVADGLPVADGSLTFGQLLDRWLEEVLPVRTRVKSSNTRDNYRWAAGHLRPALGAIRLRALTPEHVEGLLRSMAETGMARNSVMRVRSVAAMALGHAQRRDLVARNVAELAEMPSGARPVAQGRSLTVEEASKLLDAASTTRMGPFVTVGLMLGLRPGELCGLRWSDVDLEEHILTVRQARVRQRDSQGRQVLAFGDPKTPKSKRSLRMPAPVVDALMRQRAAQAKERLLVGEAWCPSRSMTSSMGTPAADSNEAAE